MVLKVSLRQALDPLTNIYFPDAFTSRSAKSSWSESAPLVKELLTKSGVKWAISTLKLSTSRFCSYPILGPCISGYRLY